MKKLEKKELSMNLFMNAIDSFNESLKKYDEAINGDHTAYKFVILHFVHFVELLFKDYLYEIHPLLIYKNPYSKNINEDTQTVGLWETINFLENDSKEKINKSFMQDLKYIKKLRNKIEHYQFDLNIKDVENTLGRLMNAIIEFDTIHSDYKIFSPENIEDYIDEKSFNTFKKLANDYKSKLDIAKEKSDEILGSLYEAITQGENIPKIYDCPECQNENLLIPNESSTTGFKCSYCGNEGSNEIEIKCDICESEFIKERMIFIEEVGYVCPNHPVNPENKTYND